LLPRLGTIRQHNLLQTLVWETVMILFGCDWCGTIKRPENTWILGLAAESIGITAARREISILPAWDQARASHPLAVHFCSVEHKDNYMAALFETEALPAETVIEEEATVANRTAQRKYLRTVSTGAVTKRRKKTAVGKRRPAA
jgi:hypothetical protein